MFKTRFISMLVLLAAVVTVAWAQNNDCAEVSPNTGKTMDVPKRQAPRRAVASFGDLEKSFDCSSGYQYGVCTDGENIYTTSWTLSITDGYVFHEYDSDGNLIDAFNISGVNAGIRDITYDGTYFYGSTCSNTVYQLDLANRALVGTLTIPLNVRAITYDPTNDGFWAIDGWNATLQLYDRNGNFIKNGKTPGSISGCAYYEDTDGEEHVLLFNNSNNNVYDYNITNDELSDGVFNFNTLPGAAGSSGGCFIAEYDGQMCFFGGLQQAPNLIGIYPLPDAVGADTAGFDLTVGTNEHGTITFTVNGKEVTKAAEGDVVTVTITPAEGWSVGTVTGQWIAAIAAAPRRSGSIDLLKDIELTAVEGQKNQWTFTMERANAEISCTYTKAMKDLTVYVNPVEYYYTGSPVEATVIVRHGGTKLKEGVDYTLTYENNVEVGTATVTVTGMGNYTGQVRKLYLIILQINEIFFPDVNFRNYLLAMDCGADGLLTEEELSEITHLYIQGMSIEDLTGIQYLKALEYLNCHTNLLKTFDVSKNLKLNTIFCQLNYMEGAGMSDFIASLPTTEGGMLYAYDKTGKTQAAPRRSPRAEGNALTDADLADAKAKGWKVMSYDGTNWTEMSTATSLQAVKTTTDAAATECYDLSGRRLQDAMSRKGIVIVNGRKVVMK